MPDTTVTSSKKKRSQRHGSGALYMPSRHSELVTTESSITVKESTKATTSTSAMMNAQGNDSTAPPPSPRKRRQSRRPTSKQRHQQHRRSSLLEESVAAVRTNVPVVAGARGGTSNAIAEWITSRASRAARSKQQQKDGLGAAPPASSPKVSMLALLSFSTRSERWLMALGTLTAFISGLSMPAWLVLLAQSLDTFNNIGKLLNTVGGSETMELLKQQLNTLIWSFAVVGAVSLVAGGLYVSLWTITGERQMLRIQERFVRSALQQDAAWFDTSHDPGEIPTLAANALGHIGIGIGRQMADAFANLVSAVACLAVALYLDPELALIMLCAIPVVAICIGVVSVFVRRASQRSLEGFASAGALATEVIAGIKTVASLCAESWAVRKYEGYVREAQASSVCGGFLTSLSSGLMGFIFYATYTLAFIFGTEQVANTGDVEASHWWNPFYCMTNDCGISGSEVMTCIYGVILCAQFFALMAPGIQAINLARQAAVDIFATIHRTPTIDASSGSEDDTKKDQNRGIRLDSFAGSLELRGVTFAYPSRPSIIVFKDFNLKVEPGTSVALVGPSGSGKSTISRLLLRFYDPLGGDVLADGVPLTDLDLRWWRSKIGYVPQEPSLFPGTIRHNIAVGKPEEDGAATNEEVEVAARAACAHDFICQLPDGYDTFYGGASMQLSGGQVQRIAIARAVIREPTILLLDEATSALDVRSEIVVQEALENIRRMRKVTTVTVAHRLSTIVSCDRIAVISDGAVAEVGTHTTLLNDGGIYAALCADQGITKNSAMEGDGAAGVGTVPMPGKALQSMTDGGANAGGSPSGDADDIEAARQTSEANNKLSAMESLLETESDEGEEEELAQKSRLFEMNKPEWGYMGMGTVGACVVGALHPSEGILFAQMVANFYTEEPDEMRRQNRILAPCFLALAGAALLGNIALGCGFSVSGFRLTRRMRVLVFEKIVRHSMGWFDLPEHSTGELTARLEEDAEAVAKVTGWALGYQIQVVAALATGCIISLVFSWQIGLVAMACIPFIMLASLVQAKCAKHRVTIHEGLSSATILEQGLREISLVQAYNLQDNVCDEYSKALKPDADRKVKEGVIAGSVYGFSQFAIFCSFAVLFYAGIELMIAGKVDFTSFFTSLLAIMFAAFGIASVNADFDAQHNGLAAAARIFTVVDEPLDSTDPLSMDGSQPSSLDGSVTFESCCFHYPTRPDHPIYFPSGDRDGFNISINSKESVAFVGLSGCGKSTALQLLLRFYDVSSGKVLVDEHNVEELKISWLRGNIGYVGQQPVLFDGTVRDNILLGNNEATEEEIIRAAKASNAHDFIMKLSDGYKTQIGAGGSLLSGGQKQRIAIARAVVKNPPILVLDEATSALDNESERIVQAALDDMQAKNPRTTLVVAHRLQTVKECDKIAVLDRGGVKEVGTHSSLLEQKGLYHDLWMKQGTEKDE